MLNEKHLQIGAVYTVGHKVVTYLTLKQLFFTSVDCGGFNSGKVVNILAHCLHTKKEEYCGLIKRLVFPPVLN